MNHKIKTVIYGTICSVIFILSAPVFSETVGVTTFKSNDPAVNAEMISENFQSHLMKQKFVTVRDRNAIKNVLENMVKCQSGLVSCDGTGIDNANLKLLDILIFGEISKHQDGYLLSVRAVSEDTWTVLFTKSESGKNVEKISESIAEDMIEYFGEAARTGFENKGNSRLKYRIAIHQITNANEAAQNVQVGSVLDQVLLNSFGKSSNFQVVEQSRTADLLNEKKLAMSGLVQTDRSEFESRGITHYLTGSLKVYDDIRVLSYQIISVNTGLPIVTDMIEWADESELQEAMKEVAVKSEEQVFVINGKLVIASCDMEDVKITIKKMEKDALLSEAGFCPLTIEDLPGGKYTLTFNHPDRDSLAKDIEIKAQETTRIEEIKMPPVDLTDFNEGSSFEMAGKYQQAIESYEKFIERYPRYHLALYATYRKGFITQVYLKKFSEGRGMLEEVIRKDPFNADIRTEAYFGIALGFQQEGKNEESKELLKMLVNEYPNSTAAFQASECLDRGSCNL